MIQTSAERVPPVEIVMENILTYMTHLNRFIISSFKGKKPMNVEPLTTNTQMLAAAKPASPWQAQIHPDHDHGRSMMVHDGP